MKIRDRAEAIVAALNLNSADVDVIVPFIFAAVQDATAAERERNARLRAALRMSKPWPLTSVLRDLVGFASMQLDERGYDGFGWETVQAARDAGREILNALLAGDTTPQDEVVATDANK